MGMTFSYILFPLTRPSASDILLSIQKLIFQFSIFYSADGRLVLKPLFIMLSIFAKLHTLTSKISLYSLYSI